MIKVDSAHLADICISAGQGSQIWIRGKVNGSDVNMNFTCAARAKRYIRHLSNTSVAVFDMTERVL